MLGDEAQNLKIYTLPFADRDKISTSARPYVYVMYDKDILEGDSSKNINPTAKITRAEIEAIRGVNSDGTIYKLLEYELIQDVGKLDAPRKTNNIFNYK